MDRAKYFILIALIFAFGIPGVLILLFLDYPFSLMVGGTFFGLALFLLAGLVVMIREGMVLKGRFKPLSEQAKDDGLIARVAQDLAERLKAEPYVVETSQEAIRIRPKDHDPEILAGIKKASLPYMEAVVLRKVGRERLALVTGMAEFHLNPRGDGYNVSLSGFGGSRISVAKTIKMSPGEGVYPEASKGVKPNRLSTYLKASREALGWQRSYNVEAKIGLIAGILGLMAALLALIYSFVIK